MATQSIEQRFTHAMFDIYLRAKQEAGYTASIFYNMIHENGGLATAKTLINSSKASDGYTALYQKGRLDLTVEAVVTENMVWRTLFTDEELARAEKRLADYLYIKPTAT